VIRRLGALAVVVLAVAGCGGGGDASETLRETAGKLDDVHSGTLTLKLVVEPEGGAGEEPFGFELHGPFALAEEGKLPQLDVEYTQIANGKRGTARVISDGEDAWVESQSGLQQLTAADEEELRRVGVQVAGNGVGDLDVADWFRDPEQSDGPDVAGDATDKVTAEVDVVNAANDLIDLAERAGAGLARLEGADARQLDDATRSAKLELLTGKDDRLLRQLKLDVDLGTDVPDTLRSLLTASVGAKVHFELRVEGPNEPVRVERPS
jgi:hypothetical protein